MNIYNLTRSEINLLEWLWVFDSLEEVEEFVMSLPPREQIKCHWMIDVLVAGGDDIDNVDQAADELKRISELI